MAAHNQPSIKTHKVPWTKEEDQRLSLLVHNNPAAKWTFIARFMSGRTGKQCRERFVSHLDPSITKQAWSLEEDALLLKLHSQYGNQWATIASFLSHRPPIAIKNRWYSLLRKMTLIPKYSGESPENSPQSSPLQSSSAQPVFEPLSISNVSSVTQNDVPIAWDQSEEVTRIDFLEDFQSEFLFSDWFGEI